MSTGDVVISVRNVSVSYPVKQGFMKWSRYTPLMDISFDLHRGETLGIIGRNGAGKSTLLRMIAGIIEPDGGHIINHGARVSLLSLGVGFVPHLSGRENAILSGMLMGLSKSEITARLDEIIAFAGIEDFIDQPLSTYSTGMRSRLGFSTAIQINPDVLLIDEVLGVGDEDFRLKSTREIKRLIHSEKTVVLVSHQIPVVKELCDRLAWIECAHIKRLDLTSSVLEEYATHNVVSKTC